jgi:hypothetical protein
MKLLFAALLAVFASSLGGTAFARPTASPSDPRVLHKSGFVVSPASTSTTRDAPATKPVVLRRSGVVVPGSSKIEYQQALAATSSGSRAALSPATSSDGISTLGIILIGVGGVCVLCAAIYLAASLVRRHRFGPARIA